MPTTGESRDDTAHPTLPSEDCSPEGSALDLESLWELVEGPVGRPADDPLVGFTIGDVTLSRLVAEGGMGRVYEGLQRLPRRTVAVKVLRPGLLTRTSIRRFLQETEILGRLQHPWITRVHAAGTFDIAGAQLPYFVMEFIPGALPVTVHVREREVPMAERLDLFCRICDAVAHAHEAGVVHRDLKPSNMLVDTSGQPKVIDFGIARGNPDTVGILTMTETGQLLGTLQYMSPEQLAATADVDARSDVYALGVVLHELVTNTLPYDIAHQPLGEATRIIQDHRPPLVDTREHSLPPGIALTIDRCLQKDPAKRFANAAALAREVRCQLVGSRSLRLTTSARVLANRLRRASAVLWLSALALGLICIAVATHRISVKPRTASAAVVVIPPTEAATVRFRHAFTDVFAADADRFVVDSTSMRKWKDEETGVLVTYWGPDENAVEGQLVYRFPFPGRTAGIRLDVESQCWDFVKHPGGFGRGVSSIEASRDGMTWLALRDNITLRNWGASWVIHESLPPAVLGTDELWLRVRLLTESAEPQAGYTVAQFCRAVPAEGRDVFVLEASCVPD